MSLILNVPYFSVSEDGIGRIYCYDNGEQLESIPLFSKEAANKCARSLSDEGLLTGDEHCIIKGQIVGSNLPNGYMPQDALALVLNNVALEDLIDCSISDGLPRCQGGDSNLN